MYNGEFKNDFNVASELGNILLPVLNKYFKKGNVIHTEHLGESVANLLDKYSGIDGLFISDKDISGVALRVQQHSQRNWETFTIRYRRHTGTLTEYEKRKKQIYNSNDRVFYPHYTCQAYFSGDNILLGGAFCVTKELFDIAIKYEPFNQCDTVYIQTNSSDGNTFIVVPFNLFADERILKF